MSGIRVAKVLKVRIDRSLRGVSGTENGSGTGRSAEGFVDGRLEAPEGLEMGGFRLGELGLVKDGLGRNEGGDPRREFDLCGVFLPSYLMARKRRVAPAAFQVGSLRVAADPREGAPRPGGRGPVVSQFRLPLPEAAALRPGERASDARRGRADIC